MKKVFFVLCIGAVMALSFATGAKADTILFPYINENPGNVSTIISVIKRHILYWRQRVKLYGRFSSGRAPLSLHHKAD